MRWHSLASGKWLSTVSHLCIDTIIDTIGDARVCRLAITAELRLVRMAHTRRLCGGEGVCAMEPNQR
jgi:hypothetical protein